MAISCWERLEWSSGLCSRVVVSDSFLISSTLRLISCLRWFISCVDLMFSDSRVLTLPIRVDIS